MSKTLIPLFFAILLFAGSITSCKKHLTEPPQDTTHKCDTCNTDTTHHPCDTCNKPCDTCNLNKDSLSHAFTWKEYINPTTDADNHFSGVWVFGQDDIYIVGASLWHFDGNNFTLVEAIDNTYHKPMNGALSGNKIFAFSRTDFWMMHASLAYHTSDGKYFDDLRFGAVNACWGTNSNDMFFVGNGGHIAHYDGTKFTDMVSNTTRNITSIWGTSNKNIWAAGFNSQTAESVLLHYDGSSWTNEDLTQLGGKIGVGGDGVGAVWSCDSLLHKKVFIGGGYLYRETDNNSWIRDIGIVGNSLNDGSFIAINFIKGNTASDYMVAGDWGFVSHWNGKSWKRYDELYNYGNPNYGTQAFYYSGNTACIVGFKDGQKWMAVGTRK